MQCRICGGDLSPKTAVSCMKCNAAFHRDCFVFNGQCGIYGCGSRAYAGYSEKSQQELVTIDESTRAPMRIQPYVEALVRTLPRWGRLLIPSVTIGFGGFAVVALLYFTLTSMPFSWYLTGIFLALGVLSAAVAVPLGGIMRRHPVRVAQVFGVVSMVLYWASRAQFAEMRALLVAGSVMAGMVTSNAVVERLTAPWRLLPGALQVAAQVVRPLLTGGFLFLFLVMLTSLMGPWPVEQFLEEIACVSVFGCFVAAPPLELCKSAMFQRAMREADEEEAAAPRAISASPARGVAGPGAAPPAGDGS